MAVEDAPSYEDLRQRLAQVERELAEALEQQTATAEVLKVIASSPTDLQAVLDTVVENAARLCDANDSAVLRVEGDALHHAAKYGPFPTLPHDEAMPIDHGSVNGRAVLERRTIHVHDLAAEPDAEYATGKAIQRRYGHRTVLATPLLRDGVPLGTLAIRRMEVRPFSDQQIALLETFADQAVIAIGNTRLFTELKERNRDLSEALEQQTATAEILRVIAGSPTDLGAVLDAVAENAARLCACDNVNIFRVDGERLQKMANYGPLPAAVQVGETIPLNHESSPGLAVLERRTVHLHDLLAEEGAGFPLARSTQAGAGTRTLLATPLLRKGVPIGAITIRRREVQPFTDQQIALLDTFADQAVIAIENARLFQELQDRNRDLTEALEQQTATADILRVIASTPTDLGAVLDAVAENAARLCESDNVSIFRVDGERLRKLVDNGPLPGGAAVGGIIPITPETATGAAVLERRTVHLHDLLGEEGVGFTLARSAQAGAGTRTIMATPLLREGTPIGAIVVRRSEVRPFTDQQIKLLETFADQAVIAIENTRLFAELRHRVEELQALGEVMQAVSSSLDLDQVLENIGARAVELCQADSGSIHEFDEATWSFALRASHRGDPEHLRAAAEYVDQRRGGSVMERAVADRQPVQVPDICDTPDYPLRESMLRAGIRAVLGLPILRDERVIGTIIVRRRTPGPFAAETVALLQTFANQSSVAIQNARLFRELEEKSRELAAASQHKSEFLANMSHELRTPLNAILGYADLLKEEVEDLDQPELVPDLERIHAAGAHLLSLINDILDLSKVEAGRMELELSEFSLRNALDNGLTMLRERAGRHGIGLELRVEDGLDIVEADERKVKQVVFNLLSNAVKFTPDGGTVTVSAGQSAEGGVEVAVRDTGIGIAPDDLPRVFEEFRQVGQDQARHEGTGLGLPLAKRFVELHGGRLWVASTVGEGSTFAFTLPQPPAEPARGANM
jgi:signal transduction histidine kinase